MGTDNRPDPIPPAAGLYLRMMNLRRVVPGIVGDGGWTMASRMFMQVSQLTIFIVAAHALEPAEFGFFAFASAVAVILVVLSEGGWREFVLKSLTSHERLNEIATMSVISAAFFTLVALGIAFGIRNVAGNTWEPVLIALYSFWILPAALSGIFEGVLLSKGAIRAQARIAIAGESVGFVTAIAGLWLGGGVVALVAGRIAMQVTYLACAMVRTKWIPRPRFNWTFTRELIDFSRHILFNRVMQQVRSYAGTLAIGTFLGMNDAGLFRAAERIVAAVSELVSEPARVLAWVSFRKAAQNAETPEAANAAASAASTRFITILLYVAVPVFVGLGLISSSVLEVLLGDKWGGAAFIVSLLCLRQILLIPSVVTEPLLSINGFVRKLPAVALINALTSVGAVVVLAPYGLVAATLGQIFAGLVAAGTTFHLQTRYGGIRWSEVFRETFVLLVAIAVLAAGTLWIGSLFEAAAIDVRLQIPAQIVVGAGGYVAAMLAAWRLGFCKNLFQRNAAPLVPPLARKVPAE